LPMETNNMQKSKVISFVINGNAIRADANNHSSLLAFLRSELHLTGSKQGCATGNCGACNVLVDGIATQSCQVSLTSVEQVNIDTIENIVQTPLGRRIANALTQQDAAQCGYCLPGIVVAAYSEILNAEAPNPVNALERNLCRCGTHSRILSTLKDIMTMQHDNGSA